MFEMFCYSYLLSITIHKIKLFVILRANSKTQNKSIADETGF